MTEAEIDAAPAGWRRVYAAVGELQRGRPDASFLRVPEWVTEELAQRTSSGTVSTRLDGYAYEVQCQDGRRYRTDDSTTYLQCLALDPEVATFSASSLEYRRRDAVARVYDCE
jgi:hypothetical protein